LTTDLVPFEVGGGLATIDPQEIAEFELEFDRVKIPAGGGLSFEVPGDDPERPDSAPALEGVIVYWRKRDALYLDDFTGENNPPDALWLAGKCQYINDRAKAAGALEDLNNCPFNKFVEGGRKKTQNRADLYILSSGEMLPKELSLSPASLKTWNAFVPKRVFNKGVGLQDVAVRIKLSKQKSQGGISYSRAEFELVGLLPEEVGAQMREVGRMVQEVLKNRGSGNPNSDAPDTSAKPVPVGGGMDALEAAFKPATEDKYDDIPF
jgi:hypothetical protein